jgi:DNA-binding transcriptional regulator YhcF (GntR family)
MVIEIDFNIDFNSEEAFYMQLYHQVIMGIAMEDIVEGDLLPSVRQLAEITGINMHTVNKAYTILKQDGFLRLDRRKGAVIAIEENKERSLEKVREQLQILLAKCCCKSISPAEVHRLVDEIYDGYKK